MPCSDDDDASSNTNLAPHLVTTDTVSGMGTYILLSPSGKAGGTYCTPQLVDMGSGDARPPTPHLHSRMYSPPVILFYLFFFIVRNLPFGI